jgi:hypothetical protein
MPAMDLVDLILVACALADPGVCHEYHMAFQSSGSLQSCMSQAQPYLAQWAGEHPGFRIVRWHCAWPGSEDEHT